jgi:hypothetical protein
LGYHDDSVAWATLDTGRKNEDWFYLAALRKAGPAAMGRWKTAPIGGEGVLIELVQAPPEVRDAFAKLA